MLNTIPTNNLQQCPTQHKLLNSPMPQIRHSNTSHCPSIMRGNLVSTCVFAEMRWERLQRNLRSVCLSVCLSVRHPKRIGNLFSLIRVSFFITIIMALFSSTRTSKIYRQLRTPLPNIALHPLPWCWVGNWLAYSYPPIVRYCHQDLLLLLP